MKIGCVYAGSLGGMFGEKYDEKFWENLWKESLVDKLEPDDELEWISNEDIRDLDEGAKDYDDIIGAWITDDMINEKVLTNHQK